LDRLYTIQHNGKEVLILDYSGLRELEMISLLDAAISLVLKNNKPVLVLSILKKNYITPVFMRHFEKHMPSVEGFSEKNAITGLSQVQLWILKAVNLWYKKEIHHFDTVEEAQDYLVRD
jgi:hypothetical protein